MKKQRSINLFLLLILSISVFSYCNNNSSLGANNNQTTDKELQKTVSCKSDNSIKYFIYTPSGFNHTKLPVIIFFDPHAQGQYPVKKYARLADKYGYILIGSLNMRNGININVSQRIISALLNDVQQNTSIDTKHIFLSGFSGGAKLAMIYGTKLQEITGVVACAGSIHPTNYSSKKFCYTGLVGNKDFNYFDMMQTFSELEKSKQPYTSVVFDGAHEWPPVNSYEEAFKSMDVFTMKNNLKSIDSIWLQKLKEESNKKADSLIANKKYIQAIEILTRTRNWTNGLIENNSIMNRMQNIRNEPELRTQIAKSQQIIKAEILSRMQYAKSMNIKDFTWWKNQVHQLNKNTKSSDEITANSNQRILNYLSMVSFVMVSSDIDNRNANEAYKKLCIYELVDPENYDVYLMYARYYMLLDNKKEMIENVQQALNKGFDKQDEYKNDPIWMELFNQPELADYFY